MKKTTGFACNLGIVKMHTQKKVSIGYWVSQFTYSY